MSEEQKIDWTSKLLKAVRQDVFEALTTETLMSRNFAVVIDISKLAERIASADGKPDFNAVLQKIVTECEFNKGAKNLYAALVAHFADGNVPLYEKYRRLQQTHSQVEGTRLALEAGQTLLKVKQDAVEAERTALVQMQESLRLSSGSVGLPEMPALPPMSEVFDDTEKK